MAGWIELIRSAVRPFIIVWGTVLYGLCVIRGTDVPDLLAGLIAAIVIEYFGERAIFRLRGNAENGGMKET